MQYTDNGITRTDVEQNQSDGSILESITTENNGVTIETENAVINGVVVDNTLSGTFGNIEDSNENVTVEDDSNGNIIGSGNSVRLGQNTSTSIDGTGDTVTSGAGGTITLNNADSDTFNLGDEVTLNVNAGSDNDTFNMEGTGDIINVDGSNETFGGGTAGANDETFNFGDNETGDVITGSGLTIRLGDGLDVTVIGSNDTFTGGSDDTIYIQGSEDRVDTTDGTVTFSDGDDDEVTGFRDDETGGFYNDEDEDEEKDSGDEERYGSDPWEDMDDGLVGSSDSYTNVFSSVDPIGSSLAWDRAQNAIANVSSGVDSQGTPLTGEILSGAASEITWSFTQTNSDNTPLYAGSVGATYQDTISDAINEWASATGLIFDQISDSSSSDIRIGWGNLDTSTSGIVGATFYGTDPQGDGGKDMIEMENPLQDSLNSNGDGGYIYSGTDVSLEQVALHEIGHALGLSESSDVKSVMFPELGSQNTTLDQADVDEVKGLYGLSNSTSVTDLLNQAAASFTDSGSATATPAVTIAETMENSMLTAHAA